MKHYAELEWKRVSRVLVAHATDGPIESEHFARFLRALQTEDFDVYLATTTGAAEMSSTQRRSASDALSSRGKPTFIVTDSRLVRGIVTAASWLGVKVKSYPWADLDRAIDDLVTLLALSETEQRSVSDTVHQLRETTLSNAARQQRASS